ncbi:MAG TPA: leucyl aminopeptidase family protein [Mesorhizobium sp.]|jgi:leucyl aminopeptidase|nr:leucyl aminopeptidase family protein [Mesorhizobium sp.]
MPVELVSSPSETSRPIQLVEKGGLDRLGLSPAHAAWAAAQEFSGEAGRLLLLPNAEGGVAGALFGLGDGDEAQGLAAGALARLLPKGDWHFSAPPENPELSALALLLGGYAFTRYGKKPTPSIRLAAPEGADAERIGRIARGAFLARDLINTPTNDMGPDALEQAARELAGRHGAEVSVTSGDALIDANLPMIHAVGRASATAPRLIDFSWGAADTPKVTLVGKGVCFDTGGLDIKPAASMLLMKKDMGGAANVLGLASMLMEARLPVRLRVLIPAVENSISASAFRPSDVLRSRKGISVEIGNTDAEGRLILADALALADEEAPELLLDMATLTGAARVALGPDLPPLFTPDDGFADELLAAAGVVEDQLWRLPLWKPYAKKLSSKVADTNNVTTDGFAGAITAALFLQKFVEKARVWAHFDIFGWSATDKPTATIGGEAQGIRALEHLLSRRFPAR